MANIFSNLPGMRKKNVRLSNAQSRKYILNDKTQFVIREAYKTARTNLIFALAPYKNKISVVTSCMPTEGKSTTALNMAITMAEKGENVLIIDCDMRKPNVHNLFNIRNVTGLSSILGGINSDVNASIHSSVRNNLDVMTAGPIPPNPAELLSSQKMRELVHLISKYYDYIFLDTPPVNVVSDALLMNDIAAGIVLVVKEDSTSHPALKDALRSIEMANGKVLGFIKVGCNAKASKSYKSYKYGKYGEYGYGYGSGSSHSSGSDELNFSPDKEVNRNDD